MKIDFFVKHEGREPSLVHSIRVRHINNDVYDYCKPGVLSRIFKYVTPCSIISDKGIHMTMERVPGRFLFYPKEYQGYVCSACKLFASPNSERFDVFPDLHALCPDFEDSTQDLATFAIRPDYDDVGKLSPLSAVMANWGPVVSVIESQNKIKR